MYITTVTANGFQVAVSSADGNSPTADEAVVLAFQALIGFGYDSNSVAAQMIEHGESIVDKETNEPE